MADQNMIAMLNALRLQIKEDNEEIMKKAEENITQKVYTKINEHFCRLESDLTEIKCTQMKHEESLDNFDKILRQRNVIFFGIIEEEKSYNELENVILLTIKNKMDIECERRDLEYVGRIGMKSTKPRPIRVTFSTLGTKLQILRKKYCMEGSGSYIKEDFSPKTLEKRKALIPQLMQYKESGVSAILRYDKIIVLDKPTNKRALSVSVSPQEKSDRDSGTSLKPNKQTKKKTKRTSTDRPQQSENITQQVPSSSIAAFLKNNQLKKQPLPSMQEK